MKGKKKKKEKKTPQGKLYDWTITTYVLYICTYVPTSVHT